MAILKICMIAVTGLSALMVLKQWKNDFLPLLRLGLTLLFAFAAVSTASPVVTAVRELMGESGAASYTTVILKALGIAVLTGCCAEICRECGENGIAGGVELVGKTEILLLCLPLLSEILTTAAALLDLGG